MATGKLMMTIQIKPWFKYLVVAFYILRIPTPRWCFKIGVKVVTNAEHKET